MKKLVLVGSGEFTPAMIKVDKYLLSSIGKKNVKVVILPTAAGLEDTPPKWIKDGIRHFKKLRASPSGVSILDKSHTSDKRLLSQIKKADIIYFSGGHPGHLLSVLKDSKAWDLIYALYKKGKVLIGSSAGAMVMGEYVLSNAQETFKFGENPKWEKGLGLVNFSIVPHFNWVSEKHPHLLKRVINSAPKEIKKNLIGIDEDTAFILRDDGSEVRGKGNILSLINKNEQLKLIEKACFLGDKTFEYIVKKIKLGVSEEDLVSQIKLFFKKQGTEISFEPIIAFGKNASQFHHQSNATKLKNGEMIMIDLGAKVEGFCSDMTRTIFFGKATKKQKVIYDTVLEAQERVVDYIKKCLLNGKVIKGNVLDKIARDLITKKGFPSMPHFLGHGTGLAVHQRPHIYSKHKDVISEGEAFTIEPGIYLKGFGGVRIEDLYVIENKKLKQLTRSKKLLIELL